MMAEQIANEIAREGGIGIADKLGDDGSTTLKDKAHKAEMNKSDRMHMATQLIDEKQLEALDKLLPGDTSNMKS